MRACIAYGEPAVPTKFNGILYVRCAEHLAAIKCQCGVAGRPMILEDGKEYWLREDCVLIAAGFDDGMLKARPEGVKAAAELLAATLAKKPKRG
jgi:hypothetical protein